MKRVLFAIGLTIVAVLLAAGCATIVKGTTQVVSISTNVDGANLYLDGVQIGTTPFTGEIPKNKNAVTIEKDGYQTETLHLSKSLEPMFWGNIITGGTLGSLTDFASGAAYTYAPATYQVDLRGESQAAADYQQQLVVRKFAMIYIDEISRDAAQGGGDYLDALVNLIGDDADASGVTQALAASGGDPVWFGRNVVDLVS